MNGKSLDIKYISINISIIVIAAKSITVQKPLSLPDKYKTDTAATALCCSIRLNYLVKR